MKLPFFSVIIPCYNSSLTIPRTIESLLTQEFSDYEVIIVDDGSTDNSNEVIKKHLQDSRLTYCFVPNSGVSAARNFGVSRASGEFLLFLDADDQLGRESLSHYYNSLSQSNSILALGTAVYVTASDRTIKSIAPWKTPENFGPVLCGSYCIKRDVFLATGGFDVNLFYSENSELFLRLKLSNLIAWEKIELVPAASVKIVTIERRLRAKKYSKKKYLSVNYFLLKHQAFFNTSAADFLNFKRLQAVGALFNNDYRQSRESMMQVIRRSPYSLKSYIQYLILLMPRFAKWFYGR
jgi:glycosyltransferase involved in cell wall biosynthesis